MISVLFAGILPPDILWTFIPWISQNYPVVQPGVPQVPVTRNMKFTLSRTETVVNLAIMPVG